MAVSQHLPQPVRCASIWLTRAFMLKNVRGFGRKRDMLIGCKTQKGTSLNKSAKQKGIKHHSGADRKIAIIGGGIAGAALAAGLALRGVRPHIIEAGERLAVASSGNRLALQISRLSVDHNIASRMSADCLSYAARTSDKANAVISSKVISLDWPDREAVRQAKFRTQFWPDDLMQFIDARQHPTTLVLIAHWRCFASLWAGN